MSCYSSDILNSEYKVAGTTFILKWVLLVLFLVVVAFKLSDCKEFKSYPMGNISSYYW